MGDPARHQDASVHRTAPVAYTPLSNVGSYQPALSTEAAPFSHGPQPAPAAQPPIASTVGRETTQAASQGPGKQPSTWYLAPAQQVQAQAVASGLRGEPYTPTKSRAQDAAAARQLAATHQYLPFRQGESQRGTPSDGHTASVGTIVPYTQPQSLLTGGSTGQPQQHVQPPASSSTTTTTGIAGASAYLPPFFSHTQSATTATPKGPIPGLQPPPSTVAATATQTTSTTAAAAGGNQEATTPETTRAPSSASKGAHTPASLRTRTTPPSTVSVPSYNPMAQATTSNPSSRGVSIDGTAQLSPLQQLQQHHPIYAMQLSSGTPAATPVAQPSQPSPREAPTTGQISQQRERMTVSSLPVRSSSTPPIPAADASSSAAAVPPYLPQSNAVLVSIATSAAQPSGTPQTSIPAQSTISFGRTGPVGVAPRPVQIRGPAPMPVIVNRPYAVMPTDAVPGVPAAVRHSDTEMQHTGAAILEDDVAGLRLEDYGGAGSAADWPQDYQQQEQPQRQGQDRQAEGSGGPMPPAELEAKAQMLYELVGGQFDLGMCVDVLRQVDGDVERAAGVMLDEYGAAGAGGSTGTGVEPSRTAAATGAGPPASIPERHTGQSGTDAMPRGRGRGRVPSLGGGNGLDVLHVMNEWSRSGGGAGCFQSDEELAKSLQRAYEMESAAVGAAGLAGLGGGGAGGVRGAHGDRYGGGVPQGLGGSPGRMPADPWAVPEEEEEAHGLQSWEAEVQEEGEQHALQQHHGSGQECGYRTHELGGFGAAEGTLEADGLFAASPERQAVLSGAADSSLCANDDWEADDPWLVQDAEAQFREKIDELRVYFPAVEEENLRMSLEAFGGNVEEALSLLSDLHEEEVYRQIEQKKQAEADAELALRLEQEGGDAGALAMALGADVPDSVAEDYLLNAAGEHMEDISRMAQALSESRAQARARAQAPLPSNRDRINLRLLARHFEDGDNMDRDFLTEVLTNNGGSIDAARAALRDMGCRERPQPLLSPSAPAPPLHAPPRWQQPAGVGSGAGPSTSTGFGLGIFAAGGGYGAEGEEEDTSALRSNRMGQQGPAGGLAAGRRSAYGQAEQGAQARLPNAPGLGFLQPTTVAAVAPPHLRSALPDADMPPSWDTGAAGPYDRGIAAEPAAAAAPDDEVEVEDDGGLDPWNIEACAKAATEVARQYGQAAVLRGKGPIRVLADLGVKFQALNYSPEAITVIRTAFNNSPLNQLVAMAQEGQLEEPPEQLVPINRYRRGTQYEQNQGLWVHHRRIPFGLGDLRNKLRDAVSALLAKKQYGLAKELRRAIRDLGIARDVWNQFAAGNISTSINSAFTNTYNTDLHAMLPMEVPAKLDTTLKLICGMEGLVEWKIITGRGAHSRAEGPRIPAVVDEWLDGLGLLHAAQHQADGGAVTVVLTPQQREQARQEVVRRGGGGAGQWEA